MFRRSVNLTDANGSESRKVDEPAPESSYLLLGATSAKYPDGLIDNALFDELSAITAKGRQMYADNGWLATSRG